jgi:hypothetical protein
MALLQNFLNPNEFRFTLAPDISSNPVAQATPFKTIYRPADKIEFGDLSMSVLVDENMQSYIETWSWLIALTKPENFQQYQSLLDGDGIYSDATLSILNSKKNTNIQIRFKDLFPISVGSISLATNQSDVNPSVVEMTFKYSSYDFDFIT